MKRMDKVKIKNNIYNFFNSVENNKKVFLLPLLLVIFAISCYTKDDNDVYFLYENGRYIIENGIPYYDWISMHEGLQIILQQWVVSVIDFLVWDNFGELGIQIYVTCVLFAVGLSMYYLCYLKSKNILISLLIILIPLSTIALYTGNARPQLWSLLIVTLTLICITKHSQTNKNFYLFFLPLLSLMIANFHSTFWTAEIAVIFVYFCWFGYKNREPKNIFMLVSIFIISCLIGFINPYGLDALISPYMTIGHKGYDKISELMPPDLGSFIVCYLSMFMLFLLLVIFRKNKKKDKLTFVDIFVMSIVFIYSIMVFRIIIFYLLFISICIADVTLFNKTEDEKPLNKKHIVTAEIVILSFVILCFAVTQFSQSTEEFHERRLLLPEMQQVVDYLEDTDENIEGKTVFSSEMGFGNFAYNKLRMKPYTDGRFEIYIEQFNKKYDYFNEMIELIESGSVEEKKQRFNDFIDKYQFDYLVLADLTSWSYLMDREDYDLVYRTGDRGFYVYKKNI